MVFFFFPKPVIFSYDIMRMIVNKTADKTVDDHFASCENIVWISF